MIDGVRMRLLMMVWNITVDRAMAMATKTSPASLTPRNASTNDQLPRAPSVMNKMATSTAIVANTAKTSVIRWLRTSGDTGAAPQQQIQETRTAKHAHGCADGDFVRANDDPADDIAGQNQPCPQ